MRGRPKTSKLPRAEQLRRAKRKQRARQKRAGLVHVQLTLPRHTAAKLAVARKSEEFVQLLDSALDAAVVPLDEYPALADLAWNRADRLIPAREAFNLYERNWRHVDVAKLHATEKRLIERLVSRYGRGVLHA